MFLPIFIVAGLATQCVFSAIVGGSSTNDDQLEKFLQNIDELMERDTLSDYQEVVHQLNEWRSKNGDSSALLWRLACCYFNYKTFNEDRPKSKTQAMLDKGLKYAKNALKLNETDPDAHKWFAILTGEKVRTMGVSDKARAGILFKEHLDRAVQIRPDDPSFHHLIGIFQFEIGKLSWFEKTMASTIVDDFPEATIDDAIKSFMLANKYSKKPWKMNCVYLVKCYLEQKKISDAKIWLDKAKGIDVKNREDERAAEEIAALRKKILRLRF